MNKILFTLLGLSFLVCGISYSEGLKAFQLKDGSSLKGKLVSFGQGVYVVNTQAIGAVQLKEVDVVSIVDESVHGTAQNPQTTTANNQSAYATQMQQVQQKLMSDPQLTQQVQNLAQDPEMMQLLSDPQLIQEMTAVTNGGDPQAIQQNPKVQQLMQNPKMQNLIGQLQSSFTPAAQQNSSPSPSNP